MPETTTLVSWSGVPNCFWIFLFIVSSLLWFLDAILEKRRASADYVALAPHILDGYEGPDEQFDDVFPDLNPKLFTVSTAPE